LIKVLFVCLGNICRSPIAEGVFNELIQQKGLQTQISCDSAGTAAYHTGSLPDKRMRSVALANGIKLTHQARQLSYHDFIDFDYIIAMDEANLDHIRLEWRRANGNNVSTDQLYLYRTFDPERGNSLQVPDPYYDGMQAFENVYKIVLRSGQHFINWLVEKHDLQSQR
jgi:protein-tyrosine phosphatase